MTIPASDIRITRPRSASITKSQSAFSSSAVAQIGRARSASFPPHKNAKVEPSSSLSSALPFKDVPSFQKQTIASMKKQNTVVTGTKKNTKVSKVTSAPKPISSDPQDHRDNYGSAHAARESVMMAEHAAMLLRHGVIDEDTCAKLSDPWHVRGELVMEWDKKYLDSSLVSPIEIMDLEKAKRIALRKDAAERKWLEDWKAGIIDAEGNKIAQAVTTSESELARVPQSSSKPATLIEKTPLVSVRDVSSAAPPVSEPPTPPKPQSASKYKPPARKNKPDNFIVPEAGFPDYEGLTFFEIIAIGRERGLATGGNVWKNRERLILDDQAIRNGTEREFAAYTRGGAREYKTKAPVMENTPVAAPEKRKAEEEDERERKKLKTR